VFPAPGAEANAMNAPAIVSELSSASAAHAPGADPYIVNLTLLPVSPEDLDYLATRLGGGPVTILSRGYGNCRITSTALPHTWWVQFFNRSDQLILNTIEVTDVPAEAVAAAEDLADSIGRLREWLGTL
jgi:hydrogenase-1 operon protein HyaF